jgi:hypothetical protein
MARLTTLSPHWDHVEPNYYEGEGVSSFRHPSYSSQLIVADLLFGTFALLATANEGDSGGVVARILKAVDSMLMASITWSLKLALVWAGKLAVLIGPVDPPITNRFLQSKNL